MTDYFNTNVNNPKHRHHTLWKSVMQKLINAEDIEVEYKLDDGSWKTAQNPVTLSWFVGCDYREKAKVLKVSFEVPKSATEKLSPGQEYWCIGFHKPHISKTRWYNDDTDVKRLQSGNVYLTEEDACKALIVYLTKKCNLEN